ncbi:hypothetical protein M1B74_13545 [Bacteroides pyogenes]
MGKGKAARPIWTESIIASGERQADGVVTNNYKKESRLPVPDKEDAKVRT